MNLVFRGRHVGKIGALCLISAIAVLSVGCGSKPETPTSANSGAAINPAPDQTGNPPVNTKATQATLPAGATGSVSDTFVKP